LQLPSDVLDFGWKKNHYGAKGVHAMRKNLIRTLATVLISVLFAALAMAAEQAEPRVTIDISGHPIRGPVNAPVTVVVFSDYL
jgi:protein-disulfide isomerase